MKILLSIAAGGAIGAVGRYIMMARTGNFLHGDFPYSTITVNVLGSLLLGTLVGLFALVWSPSAEMRAFLVVGILGSFTTFSTFSLDVIVLFERGDYLSAMFYIIASVVLSVGAFFGAMFIFRHILA